MKRVRLIAGILLVAAAAQLSCTSPSGPGAGPDIAQLVRWNATRPQAYTIQEHLLCFCIGTDTAALLTVRGNALTQVANAVTRAPLPAERWEPYRTVDDLFALIASASKDPDAAVEVRYDSAYGYPTWVSVDPIPQAVDDEYIYVCRGLAPLPPPAAAEPAGGG